MSAPLPDPPATRPTTDDPVRTPPDTQSATEPFTRLEPLGFIGLGVMGRAMARWLLRKSWPVQVYARRADVLQAITASGALACASPLALGRDCRLVFLCVSDDDAVRDVLFGPLGLAQGMGPGSVIVDTSTISARTARECARILAGRGIAFLDAPVSGGQRGAEAGTLACMIGGDAAQVDRVREALGAFCQSVTHAGAVGAGQTLKACNQVAAACALLGVAEAIALARSQGVDPMLMREVVGRGTGRSFVMDKDAPRIIEGDHVPGFRARLMHKDLGIALATAGEAARMPATALAHHRLGQRCASGAAELDWSVLGRPEPDPGP